jgi:co-chaperonin GroES (HSP10)
MSHKSLAEGAIEIMQREEKVQKALALTEMILDGSNEVSFPGYPYFFEALGEKIIISVDVYKSGYECKDCGGKGSIGSIEAANYQTCTKCKGVGAVIVMPDSSKNMPTTGVVVSIGNLCPLDKMNYKIGDRIVFGAYAGNMIPTKAGIKFKIMDWNQAVCKIRGGEDLAAFDFVLQDQHSQ